MGFLLSIHGEAADGGRLGYVEGYNTACKAENIHFMLPLLSISSKQQRFNACAELRFLLQEMCAHSLMIPLVCQNNDKSTQLSKVTDA